MIDERKTRMPTNPPFQIKNMAILTSLLRKTENLAESNSEPARELTDEIRDELMRLAWDKRRSVGADHVEVRRALERIAKFRKICTSCGATAPLTSESCPECLKQLV